MVREDATLGHTFNFKKFISVHDMSIQFRRSQIDDFAFSSDFHFANKRCQMVSISV